MYLFILLLNTVQENINQIIKNRRSIYPREFNGNPVADEIIQVLLENANFAPNHKSNYPWRFVVIAKEYVPQWIQKAIEITQASEPNVSEQKISKLTNMASQIGACIAIVWDKEDLNKHEIEDISAIACAVQNMYLSLSQFEHVGGYWSTGLGTYNPTMSEFLELTTQQQLLGFFVLGEVDHKRTEGMKKNVNQFVRYFNK